MASLTMSMPLNIATQKRMLNKPSSEAFLSPLLVKKGVFVDSRPRKSRLEVSASLKEKAVRGLTAAALTASMVIPQVAEAADSSSVSPSLNNFLLSIAAGGIVLVVIFGAVVGVSNFDPVKRT